MRRLGLALLFAAIATSSALAQQVFGSNNGVPNIVGTTANSTSAFIGQVQIHNSFSSSTDAVKAAMDAGQKAVATNAMNSSAATTINRPRAAQHQTLGSHAQYHGFGVVSNSLNFSTSWTLNSAGQIPDLDTHVLLPDVIGSSSPTVIGGLSPNGINTPHRPWPLGSTEFPRNVYYVHPTITFNNDTATARISQDVDGKVSSSGTCARGGSICEQVSVTGKIPTGIYTQQTYRPLASPADPVPNFASTGSTFQTEVWTTRALVGPGIIVDSVTVGGVLQPMTKRPDGSLSVRTAAMGGALANDTDKSAQIVVNARQSFARGVASEVDGKSLLTPQPGNTTIKMVGVHHRAPTADLKTQMQQPPMPQDQSVRLSWLQWALYGFPNTAEAATMPDSSQRTTALPKPQQPTPRAPPTDDGNVLSTLPLGMTLPATTANSTPQTALHQNSLNLTALINESQSGGLSWTQEQVDKLKILQRTLQQKAHDGASVTEFETETGYAVVIHHADGIVETREGGTRAWRNNNPGNIREPSKKSEIRKIMIGVTKLGPTGNFSVFETAEEGERALRVLLTTLYADSSIDATIAKFAPAIENDTASYQREVREIVGLVGSVKIKDLKADQLDKMIVAIKKVEGFDAQSSTQKVTLK
jgi:hypothetical protein